MTVKKNGFIESSPRSLKGVYNKKLQRYLCKACGKSFTIDVASKRKRVSEDVRLSAVRRYMEDSASLRPVSASFGVSHQSLMNWVDEYGRNAKSPVEVAVELGPRWSGVLGVDGKALKINGQDASLLVARDMATLDLVHFTLDAGETEAASRRLFLEMRDVIKYPVRGMVSDLGRGRVFVALVEELFPDAPHQACVVHFARYVDMTIPKSKKSKYYKESRLLRDAVKDVLFAGSFNDAEEIFIRLTAVSDGFKASYHRTIINSLTRNFDLLTAHFHNPVLQRDNNVTENLMKQLNRKLNQSGGFKSMESAYNFLKLWFIYQRFKPFVNSGHTFKNGKTPLQLAKANIVEKDWLTFSQRDIRHS